MSEFFEHSKGIVEDFLQTAVFLDDRAYFNKPVPITSIPTKAVTPQQRVINKTSDSDAKVPSTDTEVTTPNIDAEDDFHHLLDAKAVIDTFMEKGIICSVLKCEEDTYTNKRNNYLKLIQKADIVVLDWSLFKDDGEKIVSIIKELYDVGNTIKELRSIVIYTANNLDSVRKKLEEISVVFNEDDPYVSTNNKYTSISLFSKKDSKEAVKDKELDFCDLVEASIIEFTKTFYGIVPNIAMASVAEIRNNTHKLLSVLNKDLDLAYLSHRALLPVSDDAEKHIEEIITSEIESIIHCNEVGKNATFNILQNTHYVQDKMYNEKPFVEYLNTEKLKENKTFFKDLKDCFTHNWYSQEEGEARQSEKDFASVTTIQTEYINKKRQLTLGVIIKREDTGTLYLCLQPRCDSVRLRDNTDFIFLTLTPSTIDKFHLIIDNNKYLVKYNKGRKSIIFEPCTTNQIIISDEQKLYTDIDTNTYKYITTLKKFKAQQIVNEYTSHLSRVGLNESEYLRRSGLFI